MSSWLRNHQKGPLGDALGGHFDPEVCNANVTIQNDTSNNLFLTLLAQGHSFTLAPGKRKSR
jgi:hypothetical protein